MFECSPAPSAHRSYTPVVRGHLPLDGASPEGASVCTGDAASAQSAEERLHGGQRVASPEVPDLWVPADGREQSVVQLAPARSESRGSSTRGRIIGKPQA